MVMKKRIAGNIKYVGDKGLNKINININKELTDEEKEKNIFNVENKKNGYTK